MYILGLNAYHPDSSAALIKDGDVVEFELTEGKKGLNAVNVKTA